MKMALFPGRDLSAGCLWVESGTFFEGVANCPANHAAQMFDAETPAEDNYMRYESHTMNWCKHFIRNLVTSKMLAR